MTIIVTILIKIIIMIINNINNNKKITIIIAISESPAMLEVQTLISKLQTEGATH